MRVIISILPFLLFSCGVDKLKDATKVKVAGKALYFEEDKTLTASCNYLMMDFIATTSAGCAAVTVATEIGSNAWTIKSNDGKINLSATNKKENESLTIEGVEYFCLQAGGTLLDKKGSSIFLTTPTFLSKSAASKTSDLKEVALYGVVGSHADLCDKALQ